MKAPIILTAWGLLLSPLAASESSPETVAIQIAKETEIETFDVPEPNSLLFAGLGGLVILMCAVRRK